MHRRLIKVDRVEIAYYLINPSIADKPIEAFSITGNESPRAGAKIYLPTYTPYAQIKQKHRTTTVSIRFSIRLGEYFYNKYILRVTRYLIPILTVEIYNILHRETFPDKK